MNAFKDFSDLCARVMEDAVSGKIRWEVSTSEIDASVFAANNSEDYCITLIIPGDKQITPIAAVSSGNLICKVPEDLLKAMINSLPHE